MTTLDFTNIEIKNLITHHIGNKLRDEKYLLSQGVSDLKQETKNILLKYFLLPVKTQEYYAFSHALKLELNEVFSVVNSYFSQPDNFVEFSQSIAKLLYEQSMHPKIKEGELNVVHFSNVHFDDEILDAIGIFKSEKQTPFIKMTMGNTQFEIGHDYGYELKGVDKGCIILNTSNDSGYKVILVDNINKSVEAQYWKDNFLQLKPINTEFYQTSQSLEITKNFLTKQLPAEFDIPNADKIDLLNRSVEYFKRHQNYDKQEFENEIFKDNSVIESFRTFDREYREANAIKPQDNFSISKQAVKKQARIFQSVLKLDKNFDIYIHGSRDLIQQGREEDGRKFYKIYFDQENKI